ncbi:MAG TPA: hypothetical protein VMT87_00195 [Vicinamibacteria bacterium]|nr:hypothetical protein [Vicinamibacteria bacterium]
MHAGSTTESTARSRKRWALVAAAALAWALLPAPALAQCAMCKAALEGSTDGIGAQFNRAILVMLAGPYLVMGIFAAALFGERLRARGRALLAHLRRIAGSGLRR